MPLSLVTRRFWNLEGMALRRRQSSMRLAVSISSGWLRRESVAPFRFQASFEFNFGIPEGESEKPCFS